MDTRHGLLAVLWLSFASCKSSGPGGPGDNSNGGGGDDGGSPDLDSDGDGLTDSEEVDTYHTDKNNPDSDGDGFTDGDEVDQGTNPLNEYNRPYIGDYKIGDCAEYPDKAVTGPGASRLIDIGAGPAIVALYEENKDTLKNERLVDQFGEQVDLYSFCGVSLDLLFVQFNHLGGPPEYAALTCWIQDMLNVQHYYRDYGYQLVIVLTQNNATQLPTKADLQAFATMLLGEDADQVPVLASVDESMGSFHAWFEKDFHEPTLVHIGPELNVLSVDNDDCSGVDRDPGPYMTTVPKEMRWNNPDPTCEPLDLQYCACPAPRCNNYCGADNCPITY